MIRRNFQVQVEQDPEHADAAVLKISSGSFLNVLPYFPEELLLMRDAIDKYLASLTPVLHSGEACDHPGCAHHVSHPCEGCGRVAVQGPVYTLRRRF